jgi:hypothetical protein
VEFRDAIWILREYEWNEGKLWDIESLRSY